MPRTSRWLIAAGYLTPVAAVKLAWMSVSVIGDQGHGGGFVLALVFAFAAMLLVAGVVTAFVALARARGRFRWYDYALLVAGLAPLCALTLIEFWSA